MTNATITRLYSFIARIISLLEVELDGLGEKKCKDEITVKKNITETLNKLVNLIIQLNKLNKDGGWHEDTVIQEDDELIIEQYLRKYQ
ncbi:hypothetical protein [Candidatus Tisiphia endosymbiont of Nemotelus uliginosus]|uniref:hypothetical protein n=1 Tax=Candidatus Tisiphia endosymbiont of Nemotelus uliginosus TaxID=3077926 RepID=UPI0035C8E306